MIFRFHAQGHPAILSAHPTTLEITREEELTKRGNCIVGVCSTIGLAQLPEDLKRDLSQSGSRGCLVVSAGSFTFKVEGSGDPRLTFSHPTDMVVRKSRFISDRTLLVDADKSASDLPREMVRLLRDPECRITVEISSRRP